MSANNVLIISKSLGKWRIKEIDWDTRNAYSNKFKNFNNLEEAIKFANEYCDNNVVEYGYRIVL